MARTSDNLMKMFTSGAEAHVRYMAFAEKAQEEGYPGAAKIFRAIARAKFYHALSHFRATNMVDTTAENLKQAMEEEAYDSQKAYPAMVQDAVDDGVIGARYSLEYGMSIGPIILKLLSQARGNPQGDGEDTYYICPECGNIMIGDPPEKCPFCGVDRKLFEKVS